MQLLCTFVKAKKQLSISLPSVLFNSILSIQDFDTIVSSKISLEMESLKICEESFISMEIDTFDR